MEFGIEKCAMLKVKIGKEKQQDELNCQIKKASWRLERKKITSILEYWSGYPQVVVKGKIRK